MDVVGSLARWLKVADEPTPSDAIFVLDGGERGNRLATGLDLLGAGYAPWLLVSHNLFCLHDHRREIETRAEAFGDKLIWAYCDGTSTRDEALEARRWLRRLGCSSVLVVTSDYHTRRTRKLFRRALEPAGIRVRMVAAPVPALDGNAWPKTKTGRSIILFEVLKVLQVWLHLDWKLPPMWRPHLRYWSQRIFYFLSPGPRLSVPAWAGEPFVGSLSLPDPSRVSDNRYLTASLAAAARSLQGIRKNSHDESPRLNGFMEEKGESQVKARKFKAVNIVAEESGGYGLLAEAFNAWVSENRPATLVHVHHYRDPSARLIGYQIIYEESAAREAFEADAEKRRAA